MGKLSNWFMGLSSLKKGAAIFLGLGLISAPFSGTQQNLNQPEVNGADTVQVETVERPVIVEDVPVVEEKEETETQTVEYKTVEQNDSSLDKGNSQVINAGKNGVRTITYKVTYEDGVEVNREEISNEITTQPVNRIIAIGAYVASSVSSNCDPNYGGACVPIASDVDCGGGSGNGPAYLYETATVIGSDIYGLDRDNDGLACE